MTGNLFSHTSCKYSKTFFLKHKYFTDTKLKKKTAHENKNSHRYEDIHVLKKSSTRVLIIFKIVNKNIHTLQSHKPSFPAFPDVAGWPGCLTTRCSVWPSSTSKNYCEGVAYRRSI
jgi:hypothetical protein